MDEAIGGKLPPPRGIREQPHIARNVKPISRYWAEFEDDFIPEDTGLATMNLLELAFFWGAMMTLFYEGEVSRVVAAEDRDLVLSRFRCDLDDKLSDLHRDRRSINQIATSPLK